MTPHRQRRTERQADDRRSRSALGVGAIVAAAAQAGRRDWWRILAVALVVSILTAGVDIAVDDLVDRTNLPASLVGDVSASGVSLLGAVFLSGFLCRLTGGAEDSDESLTIRKVFQTLAWGRLVGADLLVALLVVIGLILLVIPGLLAVNFFAVVGPVIDIEDTSVTGALRRSAHLVRGHFWAVALLITLPAALASELEAVAPDSISVRAILEILAVRGVAQAVVEAAIGLVAVQLCYRLIAVDRAGPASRNVRPG